MRPLSEFDPAWPHGHVTRDGRPARIIGKIKHSRYAFAVSFTAEDGDEQVSSYTADGKFMSHVEPRPLDLVNAPAPKKRIQGWTNVYMSNATLHYAHLGDVFKTQEEARVAGRGTSTGQFACIYIDVEEGEGLS